MVLDEAEPVITSIESKCHRQSAALSVGNLWGQEFLWFCLLMLLETPVVARCVNPTCSASFDSLDQGQVFVLNSVQDTHDVSSRVNFSGHIDHITYVWLCDACLRKFEVSLDSEGQMKLRSNSMHCGS
jgi:hypothetical protein